ncbi:MAG: PhoU domain-containing protein [Desulfurococcaceae archaeon]
MLTSEELRLAMSIMHRMSRYVEDVMKETGKLFTLHDLNERKMVWEEVENIASMLEEARRDLIYRVLMYIVKAQPLGRDLITAYVLINIAYDLYRVSRYCREISKIDQLLAPKQGLADLGLSDLFSMAVDAVKAALEDLERQEPTNMKYVREIDSLVDSTYKETLRKTLSQASVPGIKTLGLLVVRHVERIVDHAHYIEQYLVELK